MQIPSHFPNTPEKVWHFFHHITQLPRPSRKEEKFRQFILDRASKLKLETFVDEVGNVIVYVPGTFNKKNSSPVIIQNHMDMVTDSTPDKVINFSTDPILTFREGDWIKADRTTLGADNGIGCAAALALMEDETVEHPPLELLFTVDEETGLKGAWGVDGKKLSGTRMLNLDTEEWGSLYIGCAGGIDYDMKKSYPLCSSTKPGSFYKIKVGGFVGGHSGVDIHEQRGNAIKFLSESLIEISLENYEIAEFRGGRAHNIIPRDAFVIVKTNQLENLKDNFNKVKDRWLNFLPKSDQQIVIDFELLNDYESNVMGHQSALEFLNFLQAFPHGAHAYDLASNKELVSLSNNLAICLMVRGEFYLQTSLRFFDRGECVSLENKIQALASAFRMELSKNGEYPSWKPVRENKLLDLVSQKFEQMYGQVPKVTAIHAGLECGILRDKIGPIDVVSFGPTIMGAHSPQERLLVPTVEKFWNLLVSVLKEL
jgi:dipeptidase D